MPHITLTQSITAAALLVAALQAAPPCNAAEPALPPIDGPAYTQPQRMVTIDASGRRLNLYCVGEGSPTVVFEAGQGSPLPVWGYVQPVIGKRTRACSYDRAGIGFSDPSHRAGDAANIVDDLHSLLGAADIKPPYVLVGHSLGGMFVRLYADTYPADVAGLVLVDPAGENQVETFRKIDLKQRSAEQWRADTITPDLVQARACVAAAKAGLVRGSEMYKTCTDQALLQLSDAVNDTIQGNAALAEHRMADLSEMENQFDASADQVRASRHSYGNLPLIVLTRGRFAPPKPGATPEQVAHRQAVVDAWTHMHDDIATLSTRGSNRIVEGAGHYIMLEQPQAVDDAIEEVLGLVREAEKAPEVK